MSESEIASLKPYQPEVEEKIISFVPSDNSLEGAPKSKLITTSGMKLRGHKRYSSFNRFSSYSSWELRIKIVS